MDKVIRLVMLAVCNGVVGVVFGGVTGVVVGTCVGLVFGGVWQGITESVCFGAILDGFTFAVTAILWDDGDGMGLIDIFFEWRRKMNKPAILFLCTNNAVRSQMAEAFLKKRAADHFDAYSAGTEPKENIHPLTVQVMNEVGIDMSGQRPKGLYEYLGRLPVRVAISVCPRAEEKCPTTWPGALARLEWPFDDPDNCDGSDEERIARFRAVRDQIDGKISTWLQELASRG